MTNLRTKESTLRALERASREPPTFDELKRQRISFIIGSLDEDSQITRAQIQEVLAEQEGIVRKK